MRERVILGLAGLVCIGTLTYVMIAPWIRPDSATPALPSIAVVECAAPGLLSDDDVRSPSACEDALSDYVSRSTDIIVAVFPVDRDGSTVQIAVIHHATDGKHAAALRVADFCLQGGGDCMRRFLGQPEIASDVVAWIPIHDAGKLRKLLQLRARAN